MISRIRYFSSFLSAQFGQNGVLRHLQSFTAISSAMPQPTTSQLIPEDFDARFQRAFGLLAFTVNRHIIDHIRRINVDLGMDPETALIWGTLAHLNILPCLPLGCDPMEFLNELGMRHEAQLKPVKLSELAQISGLPRETVRRKLGLLLDLKKVERTSDGRWIYLSEAIGDEEREFTRVTTLRLLRTAQALLDILERVESGSSAPDAC